MTKVASGNLPYHFHTHFLLFSARFERESELGILGFLDLILAKIMIRSKLELIYGTTKWNFYRFYFLLFRFVCSIFCLCWVHDAKNHVSIFVFAYWKFLIWQMGSWNSVNSLSIFVQVMNVKFCSIFLCLLPCVPCLVLFTPSLRAMLSFVYLQ